MIRSRRKQYGYFAVIAVAMIVILGFVGTSLVNMYSNTANASANYFQGEQALYIAEAGFEQAGRLLNTPILSGSNSRISCTGISGEPNLTNTTFSDGTFTATTNGPTYAITSLSANLTATSTTISVASTAGFASAGRIRIDREIINYGEISGNTFIALQRGVNNNYAAAHSSGASVSQFQCDITVDAGIPNLTNPVYKRKISQSLTLQDGWIVGSLSTGTFVMGRYNRPNENTWNDLSFSNTLGVSLNAVSMLSNADGWASGNVNKSTKKYQFLRWNGSSWTISTLTSPCNSGDIKGISAVDSNEAWAVGTNYRASGGCSNGGAQRYAILKYNGSSWTILTPSSSPSIPSDLHSNPDLNAIQVIDTAQSGVGNLGFAVGNSGRILRYNGSTWTQNTSPTTNNLYGVYIVSASEAWAVGASGHIVRWNGTSWSNFTSPTSQQLNSVYMLDSTGSGTADSGFAVGKNGVIIYYNGSSWSTLSSGTSHNLNGVAIYNTADDAWAVGDGGIVLHWDGSTWSTYAVSSSYNLNAISLVAPQQYPFAWQEIYA